VLSDGTELDYATMVGARVSAQPSC
jgi:hypothetical protein